ncbi:MAG: DUF1707 SHOCT-like domain-containing protein [Propionibacteriaceae bacterium]
MSEPTDPVPQRIGDAERDRAAEYLRDHMAAGRLDQQEFDDRLNIALTARTSDELDPLFDDLPAPKPGSELAVPNPSAPPYPAAPSAPPPVVAPHRSAERFRFVMSVLAAVLFPAAIIFCFAFGWQYWWLILIPSFVSMGVKRFGIDNAAEQRRRIERGDRRDERHDRRHDDR